MAQSAVRRVCFLLHLKPDRVDDYLAAHQHVWPEMLEALSGAGWRNYSLFVKPQTGWWSVTSRPTTSPPRSRRCRRPT